MAIKSSLAKEKNIAQRYQSEIHTTQEEVKQLASKSKHAQHSDEEAVLKKLISRDLQHVYSVLSVIHPLFSQESLAETPFENEKEIEVLKLRVEQCLQRQREDMTHLSKAQEDIKLRIEAALENLRATVSLLGKRMDPIDTAAGKQAVLQSVLQQYSALVDDYCQLTNSNVSGVQQILTFKSQIDCLGSQCASLQVEISRQETLSRDLSSELFSLHSAIDRHRRDIKSREENATMLRQNASDLSGKITFLGEEIRVVRDNLLEMKDCIRSVGHKNDELEREIDRISAVTSFEDIQLHIKMLKESIAVMNSRMALLQSELEQKDRELRADAEVISALEEKISVNKKANATDVTEKMVSMQATLHDLLSTLGNASESSEEEEEEDDIDFDNPLE